MIGKVYKRGQSFKALAAYLEYGKLDRSKVDRVDWIESRNLPTEHPQAAARIMLATARENQRVKKPVYHFTVSLAPGDPANRETMRQVADQTIRELGLQEHQVLIVAHRDRAHSHMHFMVNMIHPDRRTVWSDWRDWVRLQQALRPQEADLGLRIVPGTLAPVPEHASARAPRAPAPKLVRGDDAFLQRATREAGPHLMAARSWSELERALAERGLSIRVEGRGMIVTDGVHKVKCSEIDRAASRANLERRLGSLGAYGARKAVAGRTLDERAARAPQPRHPAAAPVQPEPRTQPVNRGAAGRSGPSATAGRPTPAPAPRAPAERPQQFRRPVSYGDAAREFSRAVRALYADPAAARRAFLDAAERRGADRAAASLRSEPGRFGALRPGVDPASAAPAALAGYDYARRRGDRLRPALMQAAQHLRDAAHAGPHHASGDLREAAAVLASAQIGRAVTGEQLAQRLAPMLPRSAAALTGQALRIGREILREQEREHEHERRPGLSL